MEIRFTCVYNNFILTKPPTHRTIITIKYIMRKFALIRRGMYSMNILKNILATLIEAAHKLDTTTRSFPFWGETDYPEDEDNA